MDVILVSARSADARHASRTTAAQLAASYRDLGHRVRWICPHDGSSPPEPLDGVERHPVESPAPPFHRVASFGSDPATELVLSHQIRNDLPDVVHFLAAGGAQTGAGAWITDRLGVPAIVSVSLPDLLCHRGTLIDERGEPCRAWLDPARCLACTMTPGDGAITAGQAWRRRLWSILGNWSPFPQVADFQNRLDLMIADLLWSTRVLVATEADSATLTALGVPAPSIRVTGDRPEPTALLAIYSESTSAAMSAGTGASSTSSRSRNG